MATVQAVQTMDPRQGHLPPSPQKEDPLASLRQRMAEKRAEIDANLSPSARARNGFDDDAAADDAADAFPPQPPPPVSTEPPMKSVELALDDFDVASLKRNLELAIATIREMQQRLVASNRAIETATAERNAARRDLARAERDVQRLAAAAIALVRAKEAHAGVALERDRLKRQVAAHKRAARSAASTPRSLADVPPRGRFPASSPVVNRRSAAASSDSSYSPGPSPRRRTPVKAGAHHLEPHPLLSGGGGDA